MSGTDPHMQNDSFALGNCLGGAEPDCSSFDAECTVGVCDDTLNSCQPDPRPLDTTCDDQNASTSGDVCDGAGTCSGT